MKIKKLVLAAAVTVIALMPLMAGCSAKKEPEVDPRQEALESYMAQEASRDYAAEKVPDESEPKVDIISVYSPKDDTAVGIHQSMDDVSKMDEFELYYKLTEYGVIDEDSELLDFKNEGGKATLELSTLTNRNRNNLISITNTYTENMNLESITLVVGGETLLADQEYVKSYKEIE